MFDDKVLLISGGTGSFGHVVLDRFLNSAVREIRVFSRDELKQDEMRRHYQSDKVKYYLGDVRDPQSLNNAMQGVDYVFHAAALKQVPSCEFFPIEAVKTNVLGTENILTAAIAAGVKKVVCLSTDKACYPVNAMGISKAMMEKTFIAKSRTVDPNHTVICGTRYGNVLYSRGSVVPLFVQQIKSHQPLTVTDPRMTRYVMSLDEAVELVLYAFQHAHAGDIMIQKAPACYIGDLAQALRELFCADREINIIGTRHGEKRYEVLMTKEEASKSIDMGSFFRIEADNRDLNYEKYIESGSYAISIAKEYNSSNTRILTVEEIKAKLLTLTEIQHELTTWEG